MTILVKRIVVDHPADCETPLNVVDHSDLNDDDDVVQHRCQVTIVRFCKIDGQAAAVEHSYQEALVTLKSDSLDEEIKRIVLIFDQRSPQEILDDH